MVAYGRSGNYGDQKKCGNNGNWDDPFFALFRWFAVFGWRCAGNSGVTIWTVGCIRWYFIAAVRAGVMGLLWVRGGFCAAIGAEGSAFRDFTVTVFTSHITVSFYNL